MKILIKSFLVILICLSAQFISAEEIQNYKVEIELNQDSSMTVTETIQYDFENNQRHGIFRFIPLHFNVSGQEKFGRERKLKFSDVVITRDNISEIYTVDKNDSNGNYFLKIGNPNKTIAGLHEYVITYRVDGSLRYFDDFDEVYWNAIGLDWKIPINNIEVILHSDNIKFNTMSCYYGKVDSENLCTSNLSRDKQSIVFSHKNLPSNNGLTIAASINKGTVLKQEYFDISMIGIVSLVGGLFVALGVTIISFIRRYQRKYFTHDPIHARYTPPKNLHPTIIGKLVDKQVHPRDISAGIIQLAIDGYIDIEKTNKKTFFGITQDYIFTLKKEKGNIHIDNVLIDILFGDVYALQELGGGRQKKMSEISPGFVSIYISKLKNHIDNMLKGEGYWEKRGITGNWIVLIPFACTFIFFILQMVFLGFISFALTFITVFATSFISGRYTQKGWETKHATLGFKLFLEMTEKERYDFHNSPERNPQEFMQYLPYAIALGVEKKWAEQFIKIGISQPDWYKGHEAFAVAHFASDMTQFSEQVSSTVATRSSGGSGSRGGGSSGGGSGGGGGGSW